MRFKLSTAQLGIGVILVLLAVMLRLLPHPANFAPVAAVAIFGGAVLPRRLAIWLPAVAMAISDAFIGFYQIMPVVWACYVVVAIASSYWLGKRSLAKIATLTIASSIFFFVVTNFAVWVWGGMYAHTWLGLVQCYEMALPFFRNTLASDAFYTAALFGSYYFAVGLVRTRLQAAAPDHS